LGTFGCPFAIRSRLDTFVAANHHRQMTSHPRSGTGRFALAALALAALIAACGGAGPTPSASSNVNKPTVVLQSPANGAVLAVGQNVTVAGAASDTVGVDHVALFADGASAEAMLALVAEYPREIAPG